MKQVMWLVASVVLWGVSHSPALLQVVAAWVDSWLLPLVQFIQFI